jgi:protein SCO1
MTRRRLTRRQLGRGLALALAVAAVPRSLYAEDPPSHEHGTAGAHDHRAPGALDHDRPAPLSGASIYQASSTWTGSDGKRVPLRSLRGRPVALAMIYTHCTTACPLILANLKLIEAALSPDARERVWFALASFDSERDRPAVLRQFAAVRDLDASRWRLYHGDPAAVRELAMMLGIRYRRDARGDYDHSNLITILDRDGVIRHQQVGLAQKPEEPARRLEDLTR